jgi:hypothetical protein
MPSARLLKILAASVGGGLALGAGIRLGEAMAAQSPVVRPHVDGKLVERLGDLEDRLLSLEGKSPAPVVSRDEKQAAEVSAVQSQLRDWLEEGLNARMAEVELRLRAESERGRKQMLDAFAESVETRVIQRISRLEEEVAGQSAAMSELRECSLRSEQSMQKLLSGLDGLIMRNPPAPEPSPPPAAEETPVTAPEPAPPVEPPAFVPRVKSSRWKIFG